jgi:phytoene dehydrogenase-like protein
MKSGANYNRRGFIKLAVLGVLAVPILKACGQKVAAMLVRLTGTHYVLGHRLWAKDFPKPTETITIPYLIIGGGISGLSAARQLKQKGISDFLVMEMEDHAGGNSSNGVNKYSKYPLGAHYLPLPNPHDTELIRFLQESKIITGFDANGLPVFDEEQLSFDPQERLYYRNTWQEDLIPRYGNTKEQDAQFAKFFSEMKRFREGRGADGKYWFDLPIRNASADVEIKQLDTLTMKQWLDNNGFTDESLHEYVDYCCRDDYGLGIAGGSAWAGIHYFCARKNSVYNNDSVLTWPEGNARLASHLKEYAKDKLLLNYLAYDVKTDGNGVTVLAFDADKKRSVRIQADKVVVATPQFVNQYLFASRKAFTKKFTYAPWLLATLTLRDLPNDGSYPLCWDNVIYKGKGLGYIYDQQQTVNQLNDRIVITYYYSFSDIDTKKSRKELYSRNAEYWKDFVFSDLEKAHPNLREYCDEIQIHRLGHGMISPVSGFATSAEKQQAAMPIDNKIYFAHSDLSGISVFEEAFHQGINAVNQLLHGTTVDT